MTSLAIFRVCTANDLYVDNTVLICVKNPPTVVFDHYINTFVLPMKYADIAEIIYKNSIKKDAN